MQFKKLPVGYKIHEKNTVQWIGMECYNFYNIVLIMHESVNLVKVGKQNPEQSSTAFPKIKFNNLVTLKTP